VSLSTTLIPHLQLRKIPNESTGYFEFTRL
jgi:hypothetical protein